MSRRRQEERVARRRSEFCVPVGRDPDDTIQPAAEYPWQGNRPMRPLVMTQTEFLEYALRELGPERARVALASLVEGEEPGEERAA